MSFPTTQTALKVPLKQFKMKYPFSFSRLNLPRI